MAPKPLAECFQIPVDGLVPGRRYSAPQHSPGGKESREQLDGIDVPWPAEALAQTLERPRTDTVMFDEAGQHLSIHPPHRDARLMKPHQDVPAGTSVAHERIGRIPIGGALGQELLEQAQALVELARMLDPSRVLEEPDKPERSGDELPRPPREHLATLAFHSPTPAMVTTKAP